MVCNFFLLLRHQHFRTKTLLGLHCATIGLDELPGLETLTIRLDTPSSLFGLSTALAEISKPHPLSSVKLTFLAPPRTMLDEWAPLDDALRNPNVSGLVVTISYIESVFLREGEEKLMQWITTTLPCASERGLVKLCVV